MPEIKRETIQIYRLVILQRLYNVSFKRCGNYRSRSIFNIIDGTLKKRLAPFYLKKNN